MRLAARGTVSTPVTVLRWTSRVAILLLGVLVLCSACGATPQAVLAGTTATGSANASAAPVIYSATARVQSSALTSVSVSCRPGEQLLGGGFAASNLFEYAAYIDASYPSAATTWTVTASAPASYFDLEAEVYCLPSAVPVGLHVVHTTGTPTATAVCPDGTVLLGGGFQGSQPIGMSHPQGNGWQASTSDASFQVYALCAARSFVPGQVVTAAFNAHSTTHNYAPDRIDAACPAGQLAVGGGFGGGDLIVASQAHGPSFAGWSVATGGEADVTISAVCVLLHA